jgi:hypothetical protein
MIDGISRRRLPDPDATIDALSDDDRRFAAKQWLGRASGELESTRAFAWIADVCTELGQASEFVALARRAVTDEERHGEICRRVSAAYAGADTIPPVSPVHLNELRTPNDPELAVTLYIIESCCLSETIGAVTIENTLAAATTPLPQTALRELLTDEVMHARMGWAYLGAPALGGKHRAALAEWLPELLDSMFEYWRSLGSAPIPPATLAHGCLPLERLEELIFIAFEDLALPGFQHVGIDTRAATEYLATKRGQIFQRR